MTREEFTSGKTFTFEDNDTDSYRFDGTNLTGDLPCTLNSVGQDSIVITVNKEKQTILFSTLVLS